MTITVSAPPSIEAAVTAVELFLNGIQGNVRTAVLKAATDWDDNQIRRVQESLVKAGDPPQSSAVMRLSFVVNDVSCRIANKRAAYKSILAAPKAENPVEIMYRWAPQCLPEWPSMVHLMPSNPSVN
jgi:hypothetical protein